MEKPDSRRRIAPLAATGTTTRNFRRYRSSIRTLLEFRHKVTNIYGRQLIYEKTEEHAKSIGGLYATISQEFNTFTDSLAKREEDI